MRSHPRTRRMTSPARPDSQDPALRAALAAHRFGLGEATLDVVGRDAAGWLQAQIGPADTAQGDGLLDTAGALANVLAEQRARRAARRAAPDMAASAAAAAFDGNAYYRQ